MQLARDLNPVDLKGLPAGAAALIEQLQQQLRHKQILIERQTREIAWRDAKLGKVTFELAPEALGVLRQQRGDERAAARAI